MNNKRLLASKSSVSWGAKEIVLLSYPGQTRALKLVIVSDTENSSQDIEGEIDFLKPESKMFGHDTRVKSHGVIKRQLTVDGVEVWPQGATRSQKIPGHMVRQKPEYVLKIAQASEKKDI